MLSRDIVYFLRSDNNIFRLRNLLHASTGHSILRQTALRLPVLEIPQNRSPKNLQIHVRSQILPDLHKVYLFLFFNPHIFLLYLLFLWVLSYIIPSCQISPSSSAASPLCADRRYRPRGSGCLCGHRGRCRCLCRLRRFY